MQIAVSVDKSNHVTDFEKGGTIKIFAKSHNVWLLEREKGYTMRGLALPRRYRW
jgi:hypothetical protein